MLSEQYHATQWHEVPEGDEGECSICGVSLKHYLSRAQHRRKRDGEGWEKRRKSRSGWKVTEIGVKQCVPETKEPVPSNRTVNRLRQAAAVMALQPKVNYARTAKLIGITTEDFCGYRRRYPKLWRETLGKAKAELASAGEVVIAPLPDDGIAEHVRDGIRRVTAMLAAGATYEEASEELGLFVGTIADWQGRYVKLWDAEFSRAMAAAVVLVRRQAGTDAITDDPEEYLRRATTCDRWMAKQGERLFPSNGEPTVTSFLEDHYIPSRLFEAAPMTIRCYRIAARLWRLITGDPPLQEVTSELFARFRDCLLKRRGLKPYERISVNTVRSKMRHLQVLFNKAGPPGPRNRDAAHIIEQVPYAKPPRAQYKLRTTVPLDRVIDVYRAAVAMEHPWIPGFKPPAWWRALLVTTLYTGLRRGTLFSLRMSDIHWEQHLLAIPPERIKSRRPLIMPLHPIVEAHLRKIRTDRELVFPWPNALDSFYPLFHRLQDESGIPRAEHFGLHTLRRTLATMLWDINPGAAQLGLGHAGQDVTRDHYVRPDDILVRALGQLPQPDAFVLQVPGREVLPDAEEVPAETSTPDKAGVPFVRHSEKDRPTAVEAAV